MLIFHAGEKCFEQKLQFMPSSEDNETDGNIVAIIPFLCYVYVSLPICMTCHKEPSVHLYQSSRRAMTQLPSFIVNKEK